MIRDDKIDIVIITMSRWDGDYSSTILSLARELSKFNRVFYIDHPFTLKDLYSDWRKASFRRRRSSLLQGRNLYVQVPGTGGNFIAVTFGLTVPCNFLPSGSVYELLSWYNDRILNRCLAKLLDDYKVDSYIFINSFDPFYFRRITQKRNPILRIYQSRDNISQEKYIARHGIGLEVEQIKNADRAIATSYTLAKKLSNYGKQVVHLHNGVDSEVFYPAHRPIPTDFPRTTKPVICYAGDMHEARFDLDLLSNVIDVLDDYCWVFVGKKRFMDERWDKNPNVHFLGSKPLAELPSYLENSHCLIIPFKCNELTSCIYPLKVNEYLAMGKPIVSTVFSEDIKTFRDVIYLAYGLDDFSRKIVLAINEDSNDLVMRRLQKAKLSSWQTRVKELWSIL